MRALGLLGARDCYDEAQCSALAGAASGTGFDGDRLETRLRAKRFERTGQAIHGGIEPFAESGFPTVRRR